MCITPAQQLPSAFYNLPRDRMEESFLKNWHVAIAPQEEEEVLGFQGQPLNITHPLSCPSLSPQSPVLRPVGKEEKAQTKDGEELSSK